MCDDLSHLLERWADYMKGGNTGGGNLSPLAVIMESKGQPTGGSGAKGPVIPLNVYEDTQAMNVEKMVSRLSVTEPEQAKVLRTEYGLTKYYDTRSQLHRAAKMDISLRKYEKLLQKARERVGLWLSVECGY